MSEKDSGIRSSASIKRRAVLSSVGAGVAAGVVGTNVVKARKGSRNYVGLPYDCLTHAEQRTSNASIKDEDRGISGKINTGGFNIRFGEEEPLEPQFYRGQVPVYQKKLTADKFKKDGEPLRLEIANHDSNLLGSLIRPSGEFGRLSFTLGQKSKGYDENIIRQSLFNSGQGVVPRGKNEVPSPPSKGVPRNTSLSNLPPEEPDKNYQGDQ